MVFAMYLTTLGWFGGSMYRHVFHTWSVWEKFIFICQNLLGSEACRALCPHAVPAQGGGGGGA